MTAVNTVLDALDAKHLKWSPASGGYMAQCSAHEDGNPSLSINYRDGKVLLKCHADCDIRDVVAGLDLEMKDLFDGEPDAKKNRVEVARYPYTNAQGEILFEKVRFFPKTFLIRHWDKAGSPVYTMPRDVQPWLYHTPEFAAHKGKGATIWIVEGEADVHAIESMGGLATTNPHGAGEDKWKPFHTQLIETLKPKEARIVVDLDADKDNGKNTGRDYAMAIRAALMSVGVKVTLWKAKAGKDASDHLHAGFGLDDFQRYDLPRQRPQGSTGDALLAKEFKPLIFAVEGILPQGLAILGAPPKGAKSFMALEFAIGVATGGIALGGLKCTQGDVLYVGLEDSERRLKDRINLLTEGDPPALDRIEFQSIESGWVGGEVGMSHMEEWATSVKDPRLIVIDTLAKAEPDLGDAGQDKYRAEYAMTSKYKKFADRHDLSILWIHHDRKSSDDDWLKRFSGSQGLTGGVDTLMLIDWKRGERVGMLRIDGRDVIADDIEIHKVHGRPFWTKTSGAVAEAERILDNPQMRQAPTSHTDVLRYLLEHEEASWDELQANVSGDLSAATSQMMSAGHITYSDGKYRRVQSDGEG